MRKVTAERLVITMVLGACWFGPQPAALAVPLSHAFTCQGSLRTSAGPVSGPADLQFSLWNDPTGGAQVATSLVLSNVPLDGGLFSVELDFGVSVWDGQARWLQIDVRYPAGQGSFTTLSPRQPVLATPYALMALRAAEVSAAESVSWSGVTGMPAGFADGIDNDTKHSAGAGLSLAGTVFSVAPGGVASSMIADGAVSGAKLADNAVTTAKLANGAVTKAKLSASGGTAGQVLGTDGSALTWQSAGFSLPYSGTVSHSDPAFSATNEGTGPGVLGRSRSGDGLEGTSNAASKSGVWGHSVLGTGVTGWSQSSFGLMGRSVDNAGVYGFSENGYAGFFDGDMLLKGRSGFDAAGDDARLSLGDPNHFIRSVWGLGVQIGTFNASEGIVLRENGGNVGIGTTDPQTQLHVTGDRIRLESDDSSKIIELRTDGSAVDLESWTSNLYIRASGPEGSNGVFINPFGGDGNVGIGTTNPQAKLHVAGSARFDVSYGSVLVTTPGSHPGIIMLDSNGHRRDVCAHPDGLRLGVSDSSSLPSLDHGITIFENGHTRVKVLEIIGGSDLSEQFDIAAGEDEIQPGMVVCIDPRSPGKLIRSAKAYDRKVAGIVSGAGGVSPGMLMGHENTAADGKYPVALTGRVWAFCHAGTGAIEPGDLLTTSETPGHAMKVADHARAQGAILGKAMSSLEAGQKGLVLVLVTLQ